MMTVSDEGQAPDRVAGAYISANGFRVLGVSPGLGRDFEPGDDRQGAPAVVILGYRLWASRYGASRDVLGRAVKVNGAPAIVIGVMPKGFEFPFLQILWQPLAAKADLTTEPRDARTLGVFGRLADSVHPAQASAELKAVAARLAVEHPATNAGVDATVVRFGEQQVGRFTTTPGGVLVVVTAVFVLLIACANVANLLLARAAGRSREMAIRASIGATRWRIVRQLLVESILLALAGGAVGLWLSNFGTSVVSQEFKGNVPYWLVPTLDARVLTLLVSVRVLASILFGLAPALYLSKADPNGVLKEGGRTGIVPRVRRWTNALLVAELALTLVLLAAAGLMVRSYFAMYRADRFIDTSRVLTTELALPSDKYQTPDQRTAFYEQLQERLNATPSIASASVATALPFLGAKASLLSIEGRTTVADDRPPEVSVVAIGPHYFDTLHMHLLRGRTFTNRDGTNGHETAIVNTRFAEVHFPNEDPIGRRIRLTDPKASSPATWVSVIGIAPTVRQIPQKGPGPVVYTPYRAVSPSSATLLIRIRSEPGVVASRLREEIGALDAEVPVFNIRPLDEVLAHSRSQHRMFGKVLGIFAIIALVLATVGVYASTAYSVLQRTREIGVRMALGAQAWEVVWLFVRRGMLTLGVGLVIGFVGAVSVGRALQGLLIETTASDPITLGGIVTLLAFVAVAACIVPARRAARLNPLEVLRYE